MSGESPEGSRPRVSVLGGGVVGITTAIHLELAGYDTALYAACVPFEGEGGPTLATTYAAASVLPASVAMEDLPRALATSQEVFGLLRDAGSMGVRRQPHFKLSETAIPDPAYADVLEGYERVSDREDHPRRTGADAVYGWRCDVYFAETPAYIARCYALYRALGGVVHRRELTREGFLALPGDVLVDCAGYRARALFDDPRPMEAYVGHQVLATGTGPVRDARGRPFSYSYTTGPAAPPEHAGEVYAYPRMDALVLGGSRIPSDVEAGEAWDGDIEGPTTTVDGVAVPARIVETNADLLATSAGVDLRDAALAARYGYRPVRDLDGEGVRVEREELDGRPVVHNYGHGGAGVTLSWGSAARVASLVREVSEPRPRPVDAPAEFAVAGPLAELIRS